MTLTLLTLPTAFMCAPKQVLEVPLNGVRLN
jgi:hypothetical protein